MRRDSLDNGKLNTIAEGGVGAGSSSSTNIVAPTSTGTAYNGGTHYHGPVTVSNDSSRTFGINPNDKSQMAAGF